MILLAVTDEDNKEDDKQEEDQLVIPPTRVSSVPVPPRMRNSAPVIRDKSQRVRTVGNITTGFLSEIFIRIVIYHIILQRK